MCQGFRIQDSEQTEKEGTDQKHKSANKVGIYKSNSRVKNLFGA